MSRCSSPIFSSSSGSSPSSNDYILPGFTSQAHTSRCSLSPPNAFDPELLHSRQKDATKTLLVQRLPPPQENEACISPAQQQIPQIHFEGGMTNETSRTLCNERIYICAFFLLRMSSGARFLTSARQRIQNMRKHCSSGDMTSVTFPIPSPYNARPG